MNNQNYQVIKNKGPMKSKVNKGSAYWDITLRGLKDRKTYTTKVDVSMRNFEHWVEILENPEVEYELADLKFKDEKAKLIDADSKPRIVRGLNKFNDLFGE
jgi:hypothetical protein